MKLSIIIPAYNEETTLRTVVNRIKDVQLTVEQEIILIDDGSTDGTRSLIEDVVKDGKIRACFHQANCGKGAAVRTGIREASGEIILIQDADLEYDPADYPKLIEPIIRGQTRVVYGSRIKGGNPGSYFRYYWGGRLLSFLTNLIYGTHITDEPTCYKVFEAGLLKGLELECHGFEFCPEVTAKVNRLGERIIEVPISYNPRSIGEGKKIRWTDGLIAIWTLWRFRRWKPTA